MQIGNSNTVPDRPEPTSPRYPARSSPSTTQPNLPPARHSARFPAQRRDCSPPAPSAGPRRQLHQPRYPSNGSSACRGGERTAASSGTSADSQSDRKHFLDRLRILRSPPLAVAVPHIGDTAKPRSGTPAAEVQPTGSGDVAQFAACAAHPACEPTASGGSTQRVGSAEGP